MGVAHFAYRRRVSDGYVRESDGMTQPLNRKYTILWIGWILAFGFIEFYAIKNRGGGDTLSEHVWKTIGSGATRRSKIQMVCRILFTLFCAWIVPHFYTKWLS